jgi:glutathione synthase/RimK-type ligase-like ATP-grasp enzyme
LSGFGLSPAGRLIPPTIFTAAVSSEPRYAADYRPGLASATVTPYDLPPSVSDKLLALMKVFDLKFGAIDLRVTPDGDYVFLEVNPAGEYLFISQRTEQPISAAVAASLERHDRERAKDCGPC